MDMYDNVGPSAGDVDGEGGYLYYKIYYFKLTIYKALNDRVL